jgi:hypothetical protein
LNKRPKLTLFGRTYCHLCDDMIAALRALPQAASFDLDVIDIDRDPGLEARYGEWVPVLEASGVELCHYHLDAARVNEYLSEIG